MDLREADIFAYVDNFKIHEHIKSIEIKKSENDNYFLSIVIPTYKRPKELKEAIDSALNQEGDLFEYEVLVVDNNIERDDETEQLIATYTNSNLRYVKNSENLGMTGNWNRSFLIAKGKWLTMLHDDDMLFPYFLLNMHKYISIYDSVFIPMHLMGTDYKCSNSPSVSTQAIKIDLKQFAFGNMIGAPLGLTVLKTRFIQYGGFNANYYPIIDRHWYMMMACKYSIFLITSPLAFCRTTFGVSNKMETHRENIIKDYKVRYCLFRREFKLPNRIVNYLLAFNALEQHTYKIKNNIGDCDFKLSDIGLDYINFNGFLGSVKLSFIYFIWKVINKIGYLIFKIKPNVIS